jgi:hypothetical protein
LFRAFDDSGDILKIKLWERRMAQFKPKSRFAAVSGRPKLRMSKPDWVRIERAYGHLLATSVRRKIRGVTREYLDWVDFERNAATMSETTARVHTIKKAASKFRETIFQRPPKTGREADYYARSLICKHMGFPFEGRDGLQNLVLKIEREIAKGCEGALAELRKESGFGHGEMWELWVRKLSSILKRSQLPIHVRKDTDKAKVANPSAFVAFMRELQACVPKAYRKSQARTSDFQANIALSTAIIRARANRVTNASPMAAE